MTRKQKRRWRVFLGLCVAVLLGGCAQTEPYAYHYVPGRTAVMQGGLAVAPPSAPAEVQAAVAAGNRIAGLPYRMGGGHRLDLDTAYDCSGATTYLLRAAGRLNESMPARAFRHYGEAGPGEWISLYARKDHVFLVVAGLRFDTGYGSGARGPQWSTKGRPTTHSVIRHPVGL